MSHQVRKIKNIVLQITKKYDNIMATKFKDKDKNKDNINRTITFREPKVAENLVSKIYLLSLCCCKLK